MKYTQLSQKERDQLYDLLQEGTPKAEISRILGRGRATVYRELKRNSTVIERRYNNSRVNKKKHYLPDRAQQKHEKRKKESRERFPLKKPWINRYTLQKLKIGWSPEQIAGRIPLDLEDTISHEAIYAYIYSKRAQHLELWKYLRRAHGKRRKYSGRKTRRVLIPNRRDITLRPGVVELRVRCGDWEGDSVVGRGQGASIHTEANRVSRMVYIRKMKRKTAEEAADAMISIFTPLPAILKQTITLDNGSEHTKHEYVTSQTGIDIYFARAYASWQRGTNENTNGLIRWYFPKKTDFTQISEEEIQRVEDALNNRPRKTLGYRTPFEIHQHILSTIRQPVSLEN